MVDGRFAEVICEIAGVKSPADIKWEELLRLLRDHFGDTAEEHYLETEAGLFYRRVFDDPQSEENEPDRHLIERLERG